MMLSDDWKIKRLGEVAELQRGFDLPNSKRIDGNIPIISSSGVTGFHNDFKSTAPGVVTGRYGSIGEVFYIEENYWPLNTSLWVKDFHGNFPKFIYYLLKNFDFSKFSDKTGVPGVNRNDLHSVKVPVPPIKEQKKIAEILSTWDKAIETTEKLLINSQQQKKALMQQLLTGKKRLLDDNGVKFGGKWEEKNIEECFDVGSSKRVLQVDWKTEGIPFYRTRELVSLSKNEPFSSEIFISNELFDDIAKKYGLPKKGDFLISGVGTLGISYQVKDNDIFYFKDGNVLWFKIKDNILSDYFKYAFQSDFVQEQISNQASVTTVGTYTIQNAKKTKFLYPHSLKEQEKIAQVLTLADREIDLYQQQLDKLKLEKKALMQQLLTGQKRVKI